MNGRSSQEPPKQNKSPLNLLSKSALLKAGEDHGPYYLYSVQLAMWALDVEKL